MKLRLRLAWHVFRGRPLIYGVQFADNGVGAHPRFTGRPLHIQDCSFVTHSADLPEGSFPVDIGNALHRQIVQGKVPGLGGS